VIVTENKLLYYLRFLICHKFFYTFQYSANIVYKLITLFILSCFVLSLISKRYFTLDSKQPLIPLLSYLIAMCNIIFWFETDLSRLIMFIGLCRIVSQH